MMHSERVLASLQCTQSGAHSSLAASWRRSYERYGLDPFDKSRQNVIAQTDLNRLKSETSQFLKLASPKLDKLFGLVGASGCTVILTDAEGVILEQRSGDADKHDFQNWGLRPGASWSESTQGTNGIGTCLAENRTTIIDRDEHFLSKNIAMTCIGVPIYGATAELMGVLDVSSARRDQTKAINNLIAATIIGAARQIETLNFRTQFANDRVVLAGPEDGAYCSLVAVNADDCIVGATRAARKLFGWGLEHDFKPVAATDIFKDGDDFRGLVRGEKAAIVKAITRSAGNMSVAANELGISRATLYRRLNRLGIERKQ